MKSFITRSQIQKVDLHDDNGSIVVEVFTSRFKVVLSRRFDNEVQAINYLKAFKEEEYIEIDQ